MSDGREESKGTARRGRPSDTAEPSPAASERAAAAIRVAGRTQQWVADHLGVSERTLRRWLDGRPQNRGPTRVMAAALAGLLDAPELVGLWWPGPDSVGAPPTSSSAAPAGGGATDHRRTPVIVGSMTAILVVVAVVIVVAVSRGDKAALPVKTAKAPVSPGIASTGPAAVTCGSPAVGASAAAGTVTGNVCGVYAGNRLPAKTIGLWTKPGMSSGCDLDACPPGTVQAGRVAVGQTVSVSCVVGGGQMLRNGSSGEPGYYEDKKWVRIVRGQEVGQTGDYDLYLSNVWFLRDALPPLPAC
ncbi:helix-turn-helix domain-containing protein [Actinoplanes sp. L3-i22]|uniref:helix-turn-helix domain-containing protein n=1 Tax=Actinoplanes sp. L3-i22 TaxID=2836373 RepID=UPI001C7596F5|nr:helix-turn-helix domain-containing protein [Actinoplanes sp. L3-i22]BCY09792.1 hypothetical protein L3i22_048800 [Actinoplanes sp. L3-i22]